MSGFHYHMKGSLDIFKIDQEEQRRLNEKMWSSLRYVTPNEFKDMDQLSGAELIAQERQRQIEKEGWTPEHDTLHFNGELAQAAACYALPNADRCYPMSAQTDLKDFLWPWDQEWWKPTPGDRIRELTKAGALIAAEIDRIQSQEKKRQEV